MLESGWFGMLLLAIGSLGVVIPLGAYDLGGAVSTGLTVAPMALYLLGMTLREEASGPLLYLAGWRLEKAGAGMFLGMCVVGFGTAAYFGGGELWFGAFLSLVGAPMAWTILSTRYAIEEGEELPDDDPFEGGRRLGDDAADDTAPATWRDRVNVIGLDTLGMGGIGLVFCAMATALLVGGRGPAGQALVALGFFGGCTLVAVNIGLMRWATFVPGDHDKATAWARWSMAIGGVAMAASGLAMALTWLDIPTWARWIVGGACTLGLLAVAVVFVRKALGHSPHGQARVVREGLVVGRGQDAALWPWESIEAIGTIDIAGNIAVAITLHRKATPIRAFPGADGDDDNEWREKVAKQRGTNLGWHGVDIALMDAQLPTYAGEWLRKVGPLLEDADQRAALPSLEDLER